jgi:peptidoglycan/LPS O-acetylase OafA/YrhL
MGEIILKLPENRALPSLEGLRLIASCAIIANHYLEYLHLPHHGLEIAVDLFFVISGIVIAMVYQGQIHDWRSYGHFVRKRIARLYPLHLATLLFYVLIGLLVAHDLVTPENAEKYNSGMIIPNLLMIHAWSPHGVISYNYVSWSISAEFFVYLCFPVILAIVSRSASSGFAVCVALLFAAILSSELFLGARLTGLGWNMGALRAVPSFAFGVWLWSHRARLTGLTGLRMAAQPILVIAMAAIATFVVLYPSDYFLLACVYAVVIFAFICDLHDIPTFASWQPISSRGYLTYSIYMLHTVVATVVISFIFPKLFGKSTTAVFNSILFSVALTFALAHFSYRYFETPARRFIADRSTLRPRTDQRAQN